MELGLYLGSIGFKGIWFSSGKQQVEQPKKYMKYIIEHSYLKFLLAPGGLLKESVAFVNGGELRLLNLTELNARSPRADFVIYDEEAQAEKDAYNAAVNILAGSDLGLVIHISTPVKASVFEENHDRLKMREILHNEQFIFSRTWEDASWLYKKKDWYQEQKKILPGWYFRQEHEASFELPMGAVFQNVIYEPYELDLLKRLEDMPNASGVDWNPAAGHTRVTVKWTPDYLNVVVLGEAVFATGYDRELKEQEFYALAPWFTNGNKIVLEDGGINIPYIDWFSDMIEHFRFNWREQCWSAEEWDSSGLTKMQTINYLLQHGVTIYVDRMRFPNVAKEIEECSWDADALGDPKIKKDPANSPHFLDAFLHAISELNRDDIKYEVTEW
jgi:hypothetical protein